MTHAEADTLESTVEALRIATVRYVAGRAKVVYGGSVYLDGAHIGYVTKRPGHARGAWDADPDDRYAKPSVHGTRREAVEALVRADIER